MSSAATQRLAVIYHPGRIDQRRLSRIVEAQIKADNAADVWQPTLWLETTPAEIGGPQAARALAQGATHLLVAGGDGTVRAVAESLLLSGSTTATLGVIPVGTGNLLARNLRLSLTDLAGTVRRGIFGTEHVIDAGLAKITFDSGMTDQRHFVALAGVGLDAKIMMNTNLELKRKIGWIAYVEGGLRLIPVKFDRVRVSVDGRESRNLKLLTLLVGNAGWLPGKISIMPDARLDDGLLDIASIGPRQFWNWIDFWSRVTWQNRVVRPLAFGRKWMEATSNVKTLENLSGSRIHVLPEQPVDIQLDGDPMGKVTEVEFSVVPKALRMRL
jgi:diacylglycerol kinase family enzyme